MRLLLITCALASFVLAQTKHAFALDTKRTITPIFCSTGDWVADRILLFGEQGSHRDLRPFTRVEALDMAAKMRVASAQTHTPLIYYLVTGMVESHYNQNDGPCTGVMQVDRVEAARHRKHGDVHTVLGNLVVAGMVLREYMPRDYAQVASRGGAQSRRSPALSEHERLARMWSRYNGGPVDGMYVRRSFRVKKRLETWSLTRLAIHRAHYGGLWNGPD
jgi:hypothetical protein